MSLKWNVTLIGANKDLDKNTANKITLNTVDYFDSYTKPFVESVRDLEDAVNNIFVAEYTAGTYGLFPSVVEDGEVIKFLNGYQYSSYDFKKSFKIELERQPFGEYDRPNASFDWANVLMNPYLWIYSTDYPPFWWYHNAFYPVINAQLNRCHAVTYIGKHTNERNNQGAIKTILEFESRRSEWAWDN